MKNAVDVVSIIVLVVASIWLLLVFLYATVVGLFYYLRSTRQLGSIYEEDFGRIYLSNNHEDTYIPLGFLFRWYMRYHPNETDEEGQTYTSSSHSSVRTITQATDDHSDFIPFCNPMINNNTASTSTSPTVTIRNICSCRPVEDASKKCSYHFMTRIERRTAVEILLLQQQLLLRNSSVNDDIDDDNSLSFPYSVRIDVADDDKSSRKPICNICLEEYTNDIRKDDVIVKLLSVETISVVAATSYFNEIMDMRYIPSTCNHHFHMGCIIDWLQLQQSHNDCPCCKIPLLLEDDVWQIAKQIRMIKKRKIWNHKKPKITKKYAKKVCTRTRMINKKQYFNKAIHQTLLTHPQQTTMIIESPFVNSQVTQPRKLVVGQDDDYMREELSTTKDTFEYFMEPSNTGSH